MPWQVIQLLSAGSVGLICRGVRVCDLRHGLLWGHGKAFTGRPVPCSPWEFFPWTKSCHNSLPREDLPIAVWSGQYILKNFQPRFLVWDSIFSCLSSFGFLRKWRIILLFFHITAIGHLSWIWLLIAQAPLATSQVLIRSLVLHLWLLLELPDPYYLYCQGLVDVALFSYLILLFPEGCVRGGGRNGIRIWYIWAEKKEGQSNW